jgi:AcrR family transcriptional regulator
MARPRSEDKRAAILDAATQVVAEFGVSAPTAKISKLAGVAEGTLFTYFANKDDLLNQLYLTLKTDLRESIMADYSASQSLVDRCRYVWDCYVGWGSANPDKRKAVRQLQVSDRVTDKTRKIVGDAFADVSSTLRECAAGGVLKDQSPAFIAAIMSAIAETTMEFIAREPAHARRYTKSGFEAFWKAVAG